MHDRRTTIGPLFGEIAIDLGLVKATDVLDALCEQEEQRNRGSTPDRIGRILEDRGKLTREQVSEIMREVEQRARTLEVPGYHSLEILSRDETTLRFRGVALRSRRTVMIKVLRFSLADSSDELGIFERECRGLSRLDHANVLRLLDSGDMEGIPFLVQEHVNGPDLRSHVDETGPLPVDRAVEILGATAEGLHHAHSLAILHAAVRPEAILLPRLAGAKVTDFTIFECSAEDTASRASRSASPHYLSPEQARGLGWPTIRSDVYSLGATFFFMLTGRPPFRGGYREILKQHAKRPPPDPRVHVPGIPERTARFVLRMLEKDPARRPADMLEISEAAARLAEETEPPAPRPVTVEEAAPHSRLRSRRSGR